MTIQLARLVRSSCLALGPKSWWALSNHSSRRYVQEFPGLRYDNSTPKDYMIVLPEEVEGDDHNELLRIPQAGEQEVNFSKLSPEVCFKGMSRAISAFEDYVSDVNNQTSPPPESIRQLFKDIEKNLFPLDTAYNIFRILLTLEGHKYNYSEIGQLLERYAEARDRRTSARFKDLLKRLASAEKDSLDVNDLKMLSLYQIRPRKRQAIQPLDENIAVAHQTNLESDINQFVQNLHLSNQLFSHTVDDPDILAEVSAEFDDCQDLHHKERTPLQVNPNTYHRFMRVCPDRFVRQMLWQTYNRRCSPKGLPKHNNILILNNIRAVRRKLADMAGHRSHLEYRLSSTMASSKQRILDSLSAIQNENSVKLAECLRELYDYAADNSFTDSGRLGLREYDLDYWSHKYMHDILIGVDEPDLKKFFPLKNVMEGLAGYFKKYFSVEFDIEFRAHDKFWSDSVQYIQLTRHAQPLGTIIYSPHQRAHNRGDFYYARLRSRVQGSGHLPARFISTPFHRDEATGNANLSVSEVITLFKCFGTVIQRLMYNYPYYELNTYGALEPDVNKFLPNLCELHLLTDHRILQSCSSREGSKPIDSELASRIVRAINYSKPLRVWFELYKAHLDLEAHATMTPTKNLVDDLYRRYSPFPRDEDNYDYCSMAEIFVGPNDGLQYSDLWSKQLASFCLSHSKCPDGMKLDDAKTKDTFNALVELLFSTDNRTTDEKLSSLIGQRFEPTKFGLCVL